uniref:Uncharacterized protein n=1 Tax=Arundo donax TaxID=35708 RepID=A0A0A9E687_ARUDO
MYKYTRQKRPVRQSVPYVEEHVPHYLVDQLVQYLRLHFPSQRVGVFAEHAGPRRHIQVTTDQPVHGARRCVARWF